MRISFNFLAPISLHNRLLLKEFILSIFKAERVAVNGVDFIFCSDSYLLEINRSFLQHDYFTDIITFSMSDKNLPIEGEVYISVDTIRSNAAKFNTSINNELHRVIFHGVLHLCGYLDKSVKDQILMTAKEDHYLTAYFNVPRGA